MNPDKVIKLCKGTSSAKSKFEKLANNKNIVLLFRSAIGKKCQTTFFHSIVGVPILPDDVHYVARAGMHVGSGIEIDPESFFKETSAIHAPTILDLLKVKAAAEFESLPAATTGNARKVNCYATLTPALAEAFQSSNMKTGDLFVKAVEMIKINVTVPPATPPGTDATPTETADQILTRIGTPYKPVLDVLWDVHHEPDKMSSPTMSSLQDADTIEWEASTALSTLPPPVTATANSTPSISSPDAGAISQ